jgi:hypothetical protein
LLNHTDLPEIAAAVAPRRITLAGSIDAKGFTVPGDAVRDTYRSANQKGNLFIREQAEWSVTSLVSYANGIGV